MTKKKLQIKYEAYKQGYADGEKVTAEVIIHQLFYKTAYMKNAHDIELIKNFVKKVSEVYNMEVEK